MKETKQEARTRRMCLGLAVLWTLVTLVWVGLLAVRLMFISIMTSAWLLVLTSVALVLSGINCVMWWRRFAHTPKDEKI